MGLITYMQPFLNPLVIRKLRDAVSPHLKGHAPTECNLEGIRDIFDEVTHALHHPHSLVPIDPNRQLVLSADASDTGIGGCLGHENNDNSFDVIGVYCPHFNDTEINWPTIDKELFAVFYGI